MEWEKLLSRKRLGKDTEQRQEEGRNQFQKDNHRIIYSGAFRRLGKKTQVHPMPNNDHVHNRLNHSLEGSCVGRSLGTKVGERLKEDLPEDLTPTDLGTIVQSACLAHDIGNPPFGHVGEDAIRSWFQENKDKDFLKEGLEDSQKEDLLCFEGNAQGFRIITQIEYRLFKGGMRLTYATLGTYLKYPWTVKHHKERKKHGCNQAELTILEKVAEETGLVETETEKWCRHPLAYLVEAADDICYALIDLEDAVEMKIISFTELEDILKVKKLATEEELKANGYDEYEALDPDRRKIAALRGIVMEKLVSGVVETFMQKSDKILSGTYSQRSLIEDSQELLKQIIEKAKKTAKDKVFQEARKVQLEIGSYRVIEVLLNAFCHAAFELHTKKEKEKLSHKNNKILQLLETSQPLPDWSLYDKYLRVLDYIAGMTDNYATFLAQQIGGLAT